MADTKTKLRRAKKLKELSNQLATLVADITSEGSFHPSLVRGLREVSGTLKSESDAFTSDAQHSYSLK